MRSLSYVLGLVGLGAAAGTYNFSLVDASGAAVPFETFSLPNVTSARQLPTSKRTNVSGNWCGAVLLEPTSGTFNSVVGTWTVPSVTTPLDGTGADAVYYLYQWVGIDGYFSSSSCDAIIQAGTGFVLNEDSTTAPFVWTEYFPDNVVRVNMDVSVGDVFTVNVTATSTTTGIIVIENHTTGQTLSSNINGTGVGTLCGSTAEWIMENAGSSEEPFVKFSTMDFTSCSATTSTGVTQGVQGASIQYGGANASTVRCEASLLSNSEVQITYTG